MSRIKTVLSALAVLAMVGQGWALEIDLSKIKVDGAIDLKGQRATNETNFNDKVNDTRSVTRHRLSLGVGGQLTDGVMARVEAIRLPGAVVGQFGGQGTAGTGQSLHGEQTNLTIENAYLGIDDVIWGIGAKVGRMYWGSMNSLVGYAGKYDDDNLTAFGVDGVVLNHKCEMFDINYSQLTTNDTKALGTVDAAGRRTLKSLTIGTNIKDLSHNDKANVPVSLGIYTANHNGTGGTYTAASDNTNLGIYELTVGAEPVENLHLGFDWGSNFGQRNTLTAAGAGATNANTKFKGSMWSLNGAYNHEESGFGVNAEIASASGDDNTAEPDGSATQTSTDDKSWHDLSAFGLKPYKHYGEILGNSNTMTGGPILQGLNSGNALTSGSQGRGLDVMMIGVNYKPAVMDKKWMFGLDYITAQVNKVRPTTATAAAGQTASATDPTGFKKDIGNEIDLSASFMKSENVMFKVGYAMFNPEKQSVVFANPVDDTVTKLFANANIRF